MKRDLEFLYEIGCMRYMPRMWQRFLNPDFQNLSEHHLRVVWLALIIAAREGKGNVEKIMKMALVHDIPESRASDVDYLARQYVKRDEEKGLKDMLEDTVLEKEFTSLWQEYEKQESIEAKIVKDADNLDVDLELREQAARGHTISGAFEYTRTFVYKSKLTTKTAKQLYRETLKSDPHSWHLNAKNNRISGGDWKK